MMRWSSAQLLRTAEFAYAIVALFALTQGPVYRLWEQSLANVTTPLTPSGPQIYFATFVAIQIPAVLLWFRRSTSGWLSSNSNRFLLGLLAWLGLSVVWSTFARHSLPEVTALVLTTGFGLYLSRGFSLYQFWWIVISAMGLGVFVSWFAVFRLWDGAVNFQEDYWIGIYGNRNSLAPVTATAIIAALGLVMSAGWARKEILKPVSIIAMFLVCTVSPIAIIELWKSKSQTSPAALAIASVVCVAWLLIRKIMKRLKLPSWLHTLSVPLVLLISAINLFIVLRTVGGVGGIVTETTAFNQRSGLWTLSWRGFQEKPWLGWGWMSAWHDPLFLISQEGQAWMTWGLQSSHNAFHDLLLGGGVPAAALFVGYLWFASREMSNQTFSAGIPRLLLTTFVLSAATQESFFVGSHFLWALLVAVLGFCEPTAGSVEQHQPTKLSS